MVVVVVTAFVEVTVEIVVGVLKFSVYCVVAVGVVVLVVGKTRNTTTTIDTTTTNNAKNNAMKHINK